MLIACSFTETCNGISHHTQSILFLTGLNILSQGLWKEIQDRLKSTHGEVTYVELFKELQRTALLSKACGTVVNYTSSLNRWVKFANTNKLVVVRVSAVDVALYFSHLATSRVSASVIESSYCALKWAHDFAGVSNPMSSTFVQNMAEGIKCQNAKPTSKKSPISKEALTVCCSKHEHSDQLPICRDTSMALLLSVGFQSIETKVNISFCNVKCEQFCRVEIVFQCVGSKESDW